MPWSRLHGTWESPKVDLFIDMGHPFLNRTVDGFLKIGLVGASKAAVEETYHCVRSGSISKHKAQDMMEMVADKTSFQADEGASIDLDLEDDDIVSILGNLQDVDVEIDEKKSGKAKRKRTLRSNVWAHFELLPIGPDKKKYCKCKHCGQRYNADSQYGTGNLKRHLASCLKRDTRDIGQLIIQQYNSSMNLSPHKFDHEKFRELLTAAVIMHDLPFQFVEYIGLRACLLYLRPDLHIVSRNTCKADCVKMHNREKAKIQAMLIEAPGRINLTSDCWSSLTSDGYICLTAHFIDKDWHLQKRILNFSFMPPPHNGISLCDKLLTLLTDWKIEKKVFALTLDNAAANDVSIDLLRDELIVKGGLLCSGDFFHLRCCAHIINLIVQDGLKFIDESVQKIRDSIKYVKGSQARKQRFLECVAHCSLESKKGLRQDVSTRWNSTYIMLENALYYRRAFHYLELSDENYKHNPSRLEWERIEKINKFLASFYEITCVFSGTKYPTANLYFPAVFTTYLSLRDEIEGGDEKMSKMAKEMFIKFTKYWSAFCDTLAIGIILDPRYKFTFVEWCYKKLHGDEELYQIINLKNKLFALYNEYAKETSIQCAATSSSSNKGSHSQSSGTRIINSSSMPGKQDVFKEFDSFEREEFTHQKSQLESYLDEPRVDRKSKLDILAYWRANQFRYPEVARMARDILAIPVSTVASESSFSVGGRVLDQYRSALKPDIVEALVCTRDWLYGDQDTKMELEELTSDVMSLNLNDKEGQSECSNSIQLDK